MGNDGRQYGEVDEALELDAAIEAADEIMSDFRERKGLRRGLDQYDDEAVRQIRNMIALVIRRHIERGAPDAVRSISGEMLNEARTCQEVGEEHAAEVLVLFAIKLEKTLASAPASEAVPDSAADVSADRNWIAGAKFGWNCGVSGDHERYRQATESRQRDIRQHEQGE